MEWQQTALVIVSMINTHSKVFASNHPILIWKVLLMHETCTILPASVRLAPIALWHIQTLTHTRKLTIHTRTHAHMHAYTHTHFLDKSNFKILGIHHPAGRHMTDSITSLVVIL